MVHCTDTACVVIAKSGTDIAYGAIGRRARYAKSGTDIAYGAIGRRARYAKSGTDIAYGARADARKGDPADGPRGAKSNTKKKRKIS
eukprot:2787073-Rhodomonas_salina.1